jgi:hypothetical protein
MDAFMLPIAATGFTVAFLHAAIPTHWLPFVLAGRGQGWSARRTLAVTALAGLGHVLFTTVLGILVVWLGIELSGLIGSVFPYIAGGALIGFGLFYILRGGAHGHHHHHGGDHAHHHEGDDRGGAPVRYASDRAAVVSLFALLTFSPCEGFLPVYFSGIRYGWAGFALLSVVLAGATLAGMVIFTWLSLLGFQRIKLGVLERYEGAILGAILCLFGAAVIVFES